MLLKLWTTANINTGAQALQLQTGLAVSAHFAMFMRSSIPSMMSAGVPAVAMKSSDQMLNLTRAQDGPPSVMPSKGV